MIAVDWHINYAGLAFALGACTAGAPLQHLPAAPEAARSCATASARISFDFEGAAAARCVIDGERAFTLLIGPEHAPPINPSPWYAFRYDARPDGELTVRLRYIGGKHRYAPLWTSGTKMKQLPVEVAADGATASMSLPEGAGTVSAQEMIGLAQYDAALARWTQTAQGQRIVLGQSLDGREIWAARFGRLDAPKLVLLLGRQHPPEVSGAIAMETFVDQLAQLFAADSAIGRDLQFLVVPLLNPDGVVHGHWRGNRGGIDLNRDWGNFTQPETQAVKRWLETLPAAVRPAAMIDFHSTQRNLFYVQGDEAGESGAAFLSAWLGGKETSIAGYAFAIVPRNANPGSGTAKNWFFESYGIPAYTYEVADGADRAATRRAAQLLATELLRVVNVQP